MTDRRREPMTIAMVCVTIALIIWSAFYQSRTSRLRHLRELSAKDSVAVEIVPEPVISQYDSFVKACSDSVGLDWRLVSAVIFHESGFDNDVVSPRGAVGLMQLMPVIAEKMGVEDATDPEGNVRAGTRYLRDLYDRFSETVPDSLERRKYMLASYNAGYGRVMACIRTAASKGLDVTKWENIEAVPSEVQADSLTPDSVSVEKTRLLSLETISFVRKILNTYAEYQGSSIK